jgi:hypothetical protein
MAETDVLGNDGKAVVPSPGYERNEKDEIRPPDIHADLVAADRVIAELNLEIEEAERHFPGGKFPPILSRCVGHFLAGPILPAPGGLTAWWESAREQVHRMIAAVQADPERWTKWKPPVFWPVF